MKKRVGEGLQMFGTMRMILKAWSVSLDVRREMYERVVTPTVTCRAETLNMRVEERRILDVIDNK